jgi:hypothetical protein
MIPMHRWEREKLEMLRRRRVFLDRLIENKAGTKEQSFIMTEASALDWILELVWKVYEDCDPGTEVNEVIVRARISAADRRRIRRHLAGK